MTGPTPPEEVRQAPVTVRTAVPGDAETLRAALLGMMAAQGLQAPTDLGPSIRYLLEFPSAECLLAERNGSPAGVLQISYRFSTFAGRPAAYLDDVFVWPHERGRGVVDALFAEAERRAVARGCIRIALDVDADNHRARRAYERLGFRESGADLLVKPLTPG